MEWNGSLDYQRKFRFDTVKYKLSFHHFNSDYPTMLTTLCSIRGLAHFKRYITC